MILLAFDAQPLQNQGKPTIVNQKQQETNGTQRKSKPADQRNKKNEETKGLSGGGGGNQLGILAKIAILADSGRRYHFYTKCSL